MKASLIKFQTPDKLTLPGLLFKTTHSEKADHEFHSRSKEFAVKVSEFLAR